MAGEGSREGERGESERERRKNGGRAGNIGAGRGAYV
jgi:hypothetical protein